MIVNYSVYTSRVAELKRRKVLPRTARPKKLVASILPKPTDVAADILLQPENLQVETLVIPKKPRTPKPSKAETVRENDQAKDTSSGHGDQLDEQQLTPPKRRKLVKIAVKEKKQNKKARKLSLELIPILSPEPISQKLTPKKASPPKLTISVQSDTIVRQPEIPLSNPTSSSVPQLTDPNPSATEAL